MRTFETTLGDLISRIYKTYEEAYGDSSCAAVATAATMNDLLAAYGEPAGADGDEKLAA